MDTPSDSDSSPKLSKRDLQVLRLLAWGHTSKEIGLRMQLRKQTIGTLKGRGFAKLGIATQHELVKHAVKNGVV